MTPVIGLMIQSSRNICRKKNGKWKWNEGVFFMNILNEECRCIRIMIEHCKKMRDENNDDSWDNMISCLEEELESRIHKL